MRPVPDPLYGVTVDNVDNISGIVQALSHLSHKPTVRIVFDPGEPPATYTQAVDQIEPVAYIMGTFADSSAMRLYTTASYEQRVTQYLNAFRTQVDIWEIGNEVNGEWLGSDTIDKIIGAYKLVSQAGLRTAMTLYYNGLDDTNNCYADSDNLMFRWAQANLPDAMKDGLDYVFISYYEQDCPGVSMDWKSIFTQLHHMFPYSRIGFGENGTTQPTDPTALKVQYMSQFYPHWVDVPCYVAGHFWWYFAEDGVPDTDNPLWTALNADMNALVVPQHATCPSAPGA